MNSRAEVPKSLRAALSIRSRSPKPISSDEVRNFLIGDKEETIYLIIDKAGQPIGYVIYALISKDCLNLIRRNLTTPKYAYEWSEGKIVLIVDICFLPHRSVEASSRLRTYLKRFKLLCYVRKDTLKVFSRKAGIHRRVEHSGNKWQALVKTQKFQ